MYWSDFSMLAMQPLELFDEKIPLAIPIKNDYHIIHAIDSDYQ
jgi:hypothetical protein